MPKPLTSMSHSTVSPSLAGVRLSTARFVILPRIAALSARGYHWGIIKIRIAGEECRSVAATNQAYPPILVYPTASGGKRRRRLSDSDSASLGSNPSPPANLFNKLCLISSDFPPLCRHRRKIGRLSGG